MQTKEKIPLTIRRYIENVDTSELAKKSGISWPTMNNLKKHLIDCGALKNTSSDKLVLNPEYESFAGIYFKENAIELSIIDFSGKQIYFVSKSYSTALECVETLVELLRFKELQKVKAVTICSDDYYIESNAASLNQYLLLNDTDLRHFVPQGIEYCCEKTCVTNSFKWYDVYNPNDDELNVIISFYKDNCYYAILKNNFVIQKRRCTNIVKESEEFYKDVIFPILKFINPDNIIFIRPYDESFDFIENNISLLKHKITIDYYNLNRGFGTFERKTTKCDIVEIKPAESAALYAMYRYYGWA